LSRALFSPQSNASERVSRAWIVEFVAPEDPGSIGQRMEGSDISALDGHTR